jgi:signal transduction histidine kinase
MILLLLGLGMFTIIAGVIAVLMAFFTSRRMSTPIISLTEIATKVASGDLTRRMHTVRSDEIGALSFAFNDMADQLEELIGSLEERVNARTRDLQIASDVSKQLTTVLDIDRLLQQVATLTSTSFGFYSAAVFLLDEEKKMLVPVAASDAAGLALETEEIGDIPLDAEPSVIALVARNREAVTIDDATQSPIYLFLPALPDTRSELAIPMVLGEQLLGVFDLQSEVPNRFNEEDLRVLTALAEQIAIAVRNAQLYTEAHAAREAAEEANRVKSNFLANMSHELRTPLNAILGFAQLMERASGVTPTQQEHLGIINRSGEHLLALINDVLEMSKIEAGRMALVVHDFDLYRTLDTLEKMLRVRAEKKGLQFLFECDAGVPQYVCADEKKLRQVLVNLLGNAIKFTDQGGVTLRVAYQNSVAEPRLLFEVEDTGVGIAPEEMDILFDPFVQSQRGEHFQEGTGLGLPISRRFVQLMGGDITISSEVGKGTLCKFDVQIEAVQTVEDLMENRLLLVNLLEAVGFEVREAVNGQEGVELSEQWEPHLIFMDMRMPVMDGLEATKHIKATSKGQAMKIIALTASAFDQDQALALQAGCDDFVSKPFRAPELFDKMARHLGVQFTYEELQPVEALSSEAGATLSATMLTDIPPTLINRLKQSVTDLNIKETFAIIEEMRTHSASLANGLTEQAKSFQFEKMLALIEQWETLNSSYAVE